VRIVNGKAVINNSVLMNDFGLDEVSSTHQVGDAFDSADHAAMAWGFMYNGKSITDNIEYASAIYEDGGKYKYTAIIGGQMLTWEFQLHLTGNTECYNTCTCGVR